MTHSQKCYLKASFTLTWRDDSWCAVSAVVGVVFLTSFMLCVTYIPTHLSLISIPSASQYSEVVNMSFLKIKKTHGYKFSLLCITAFKGWRFLWRYEFESILLIFQLSFLFACRIYQQIGFFGYSRLVSCRYTAAMLNLITNINFVLFVFLVKCIHLI